jgi:hypothetical protein
VADATGAIAQCAQFTRGGNPPVPDHDADQRTRTARLKKEQHLLVEWAQKNGKIVAGPLSLEYLRGGEHRVYFRSRAKRVVKITLADKHKGYGIALGSWTHGATPSEYLDRLDLQNKIFNDNIRLEGVAIVDDFPLIITSQPAIKGTEPPQDAIDEMMIAKGYERLIEGAYYDSENGLLVYDLFPRNAMRAADGVIYPFDPVIQRVTPDFVAFLRSAPDRIHNR